MNSKLFTALAVICALSTTPAFAARKKVVDTNGNTTTTVTTPVAHDSDSISEHHSSSSTHMDADILDAGTKGIGFSFPNGGGGVISGAYFLQKGRAIRVDLGLDLNKKDPADLVFGFSIDAGYRMYCLKTGNLAVFMQPGFYLNRAAASSAPVTLGPSASVGGEYFFNNNLSFGVYTGVNLTLTDSFKSVRFNTGTSAITGSLYW